MTMVRTVILDGHEVQSDEISPLRHRCIGFFRSAQPPFPTVEQIQQGIQGVACRCGGILFGRAAVEEHWRDGHFDVMQYATIDWTSPCSAR